MYPPAAICTRYYYSYQYLQIQRLYTTRALASQQVQGFHKLTDGIPLGRMPAASSLLRRHCVVDADGEVAAGYATDTLALMGAVARQPKPSSCTRQQEAEAQRGRAWVSADATAVSLHPGFVVVRNALDLTVSLLLLFYCNCLNT